MVDVFINYRKIVDRINGAAQKLDGTRKKSNF